MKKEICTFKTLLIIAVIALIITMAVAIARIGQTASVVKDKINNINIDDLTSIAKCDIQFKDLKYSGICSSDVIDAVRSYGEYELFNECASKYGLEECRSIMK